MKTRFNRTIAKEIAETSWCYVLDCLMGYSDTGYNLSTEKNEFETNFEEDLEEKNIVITDKRIAIIGEYYEQFRNKFKKKIEDKYYKR